MGGPEDEAVEVVKGRWVAAEREILWRLATTFPVFVIGEGTTGVGVSRGAVNGEPVFALTLWEGIDQRVTGTQISEDLGRADAVLAFKSFDRMAFVWKALIFGDIDLPPAAAAKIAAAREEWGVE